MLCYITRQWCEQDPRCNRLLLTDLLISPMQHCTKVPLMLNSICRYTQNAPERKLLMESLEKLESSLRKLWLSVCLHCISLSLRHSFTQSLIDWLIEWFIHSFMIRSFIFVCCVWLPICIIMFMFLTVCSPICPTLFLPMSLSRSVCRSLFLPVYLYLSLSLYYHLYFSLCLSVSLFVAHSLSLYVSLSRSDSFWLSMSPSLCFIHSLNRSWSDWSNDSFIRSFVHSSVHSFFCAFLIRRLGWEDEMAEELRAHPRDSAADRMAACHGIRTSNLHTRGCLHLSTSAPLLIRSIVCG